MPKTVLLGNAFVLAACALVSFFVPPVTIGWTIFGLLEVAGAMAYIFAWYHA